MNTFNFLEWKMSFLSSFSVSLRTPRLAKGWNITNHQLLLRHLAYNILLIVILKRLTEKSVRFPDTLTTNCINSAEKFLFWSYILFLGKNRLQGIFRYFNVKYHFTKLGSLIMKYPIQSSSKQLSTNLKA